MQTPDKHENKINSSVEEKKEKNEPIDFTQSENQDKKNNDESNFDYKFCYYIGEDGEKKIDIGLLLFWISLITIYFGVSITTLVMTIVYEDKIQCKNAPSIKILEEIGVFKYNIISESVLIIFTSVVILYTLILKQNINTYIIIIFAIIWLFRFSWVIIGFVIFGNYCTDLYTPVKGLSLTSIIIKLLEILIIRPKI
jgi:hypothetical protein